jgi:hypothetical protein
MAITLISAARTRSERLATEIIRVADESVRSRACRVNTGPTLAGQRSIVTHYQVPLYLRGHNVAVIPADRGAACRRRIGLITRRCPALARAAGPHLDLEPAPPDDGPARVRRLLQHPPPHRDLNRAAPLRPLPDGVTDP